jgi:hypothetical protein
MYKFGATIGEQGFLELREERQGFLLCIGDCFDDGGEGECMPIFSFSKRMSRGDVEGLVAYLEERMRSRPRPQ